MQENQFEYKVTVVIPIYNVEQYITDALDSLLSQTIPQQEIEVLMINDGSTDNSAIICQKYVEKYTNFKLVTQENCGVSSARNRGIRNAKGKYIFYLDGDDKLSKETIKNVTDFFDNHYDEIDIVAYPRFFWYKDGRKIPHTRDKFMSKTKVYSLAEIPYVSFSTLNIAIKNGNNIDLFDENLFFHEDEVYITNIILKKKKIGYVCCAEYLYRKHGSGLTDTSVNPYYIFEPTIKAYEELFKKYTYNGKVDVYVQSLVLNDFGWKIVQDVIFPYHYEGSQYDLALQRIRNLLNQIDDDLILNHANIDIYHRFYLLSLKDNQNLHLYTGKNAIVLCRDEQILRMERNITIVFSKIKIEDNYVEWWGFLKSPFFLFSSKPELYAIITKNGTTYREPIYLIESAYSYYKSKIKTATFWQFSFRVASKNKTSIIFDVSLNKNSMDYKYFFMSDLSFKTNAKFQQFNRKGTKCTKHEKIFTIEKIREEQKVNVGLEHWYWKNRKKFWLVRKLSLFEYKKGKRIWLYYDSTGVGKDNGYYQYIHDIKQIDGIERYYITHDKSFAKSDAFEGIPHKNIVIFGSRYHKLLYLKCEKVITAYIENYNYLPFDLNTYGHYRDINEPEIIYLQHGVLHAHQPQKYSLEKLNIDKEVVSTFYEIDNLIRNYHFTYEHLIFSGMPRYDYIDTKSINIKNKILLAPSWRQYLIATNGAGEWIPIYNRFKNSKFYQELKKFLDSYELAELLERYNYTIDLKLHPIFGCYKECFDFNNPRIQLADTNIKAEEYSVFISDYSSFSFDFVYLKRPIIYFFPDYEMFKAGLMSYRQLDISLEDGFGPLTQTANEAINALKLVFENFETDKSVFHQRMEKFFLYYDNEQCDRIYRALTEESLDIDENIILEDLLKSNL